MRYRICNRRCRRKEPELGSSSQEAAEPHSISASAPTKALQPTSLDDVVNSVFRDAAVGAGVILLLRPAHVHKKLSACKQRISMRNAAHSASRQGLEHHGMFLLM